MSREEAIENFKEFIDHFQTQIRHAQAINDKAFDVERAERDIQTFEMAIKALEQEPCEDISGDGTLTVNVKDGRKVTRVLVCGDNHWGGLFYPDEQEPCDDAVSREAVLNEFYDMENLYERIKQLPSVNPQPCDDAISREAVDEIKELMTDINGDTVYAVRMSDIRELPSVTHKSGKWIPISEGLPEEGRTVIASTEYGVYGEARYTKEYGWEWPYEAGADYWKELEGVTAWMPLPKPYEPQESESDV